MRRFIAYSSILLNSIWLPPALPVFSAVAQEISTDVGCDDATKWMIPTGWAVTGGKCVGTSVTNLRMLMQMSPKIKKDHIYEITGTVTNYGGVGSLRFFAGLSMPAATPGTVILASSFTPIADRFDLNTVLTSGAEDLTGSLNGPGNSAEVGGSARVFCQHAGFGWFDPFLNPGKPGAGHPHEFQGLNDVSANTTYQTARTKGGSSCQSQALPHNKPIWPAIYMWPALIVGEGANARLQRSEQGLVYYKGPGKPDIDYTGAIVPDSQYDCVETSPAGTCPMLPDGIRFIFGFNKANGQGRPDMPIYGNNDVNHGDNGTGAATSGTMGAIDMYCVKGWELAAKENPADPSTLAVTQLSPIYHNLEELKADVDVNPSHCPIGGKLHVGLGAPWCWNGTELDSPDHRRHMSYGILPTAHVGNGRCPTSHPVRVTQMSTQFYFTITQELIDTGRTSVEEMDETLPRGVGWHMDYMLSGSPAVRLAFKNNCVEPHNSCTNTLGNGKAIPGPKNTDGTDPFCNGCAKARPDRFMDMRLLGMSKGFVGNGTFKVRVRASGPLTWGAMGRKGWTGQLDNLQIKEVPTL